MSIYYQASQEHRKFFSAGKYGGKQEALEQAVAYREAYKRQQPPPEKRPYQRAPLATNTSGVNGVSETYQRNRTGEKIACFQVFYAPRLNVRQTKRCYHHQYGSRVAALKAATEYRKEKEAEILRLHKAGQR